MKKLCWWLGTDQALSHHLNLWWSRWATHICGTRRDELKVIGYIDKDVDDNGMSSHIWYILESEMPIVTVLMNNRHCPYNAYYKVGISLHFAKKNCLIVLNVPNMANYIYCFNAVKSMTFSSKYLVVWFISNAWCAYVHITAYVVSKLNSIQLNSNNPICVAITSKAVSCCITFSIRTLAYKVTCLLGMGSIFQANRTAILYHQPCDCLLNRLLRRRWKKTSKLRVTGLYEGNSLVTEEFSAQRASNAENVSIWWRHH